MTLLYGIPNCDTVKKARAWLAGQEIACEFHDFKKAGVPAERLAAWVDALGWERVLNRKGTAWRKLDAQIQAGVQDAASARAVMLTQVSVIKRPVVDWSAADATVGFDAEAWSQRV